MSSANKHLKKYSSDFKLRVVLKYLSGQCTTSQICVDFNVEKSTLHKWVSQLRQIAETYFMKLIHQITIIKLTITTKNL